MSVQEAKARFADAAAAARGEHMVATKHGRPFVELVSARVTPGMDFDKADVVRRTLGLDRVGVGVPADFDDAAFGCRVVGRLNP